MSSLLVFIRNFLQNKGHFVFLSLLIAKVCGFVGSLLIFRLLDKIDMGAVTMIMSLSAVFLAFSGFGSQQGLLRYGSLEQNIESKNNISAYLFRTGFINHLIVSAIFLCSSVFYIQKYDQILYLFVFFTIRLIGYYFYNYIQSELRINQKNEEFAKVNNVVNIGGLFLMLVLTYFGGLTGYLISLAIAPYLSFFWYKSFKIKKNQPLNIDKKQLWNYNLQSAGTAFLSDSLFALDVLILGLVINEVAVADYRAAILLPSNITFLAITFMQSDFTTLAKEHQNKSFLKDYIYNYYKIFIPICLLIFSIGYLLKDDIVKLVSGAQYQDLGYPFLILLAAFLLNILLRNLYGNLLSAVGLMKVNTIVSASVLVILISTSFFLVPIYGVVGMAYSMLFSLQFTGLILMLSFFSYLKKL